MTINQVLAAAAILFAILALVGLGGVPWLALGVIALGLALILNPTRVG